MRRPRNIWGASEGLSWKTLDELSKMLPRMFRSLHAAILALLERMESIRCIVRDGGYPVLYFVRGERLSKALRTAESGAASGSIVMTPTQLRQLIVFRLAWPPRAAGNRSSDSAVRTAAAETVADGAMLSAQASLAPLVWSLRWLHRGSAPPPAGQPYRHPAAAESLLGRGLHARSAGAVRPAGGGSSGRQRRRRRGPGISLSEPTLKTHRASALPRPAPPVRAPRETTPIGRVRREAMFASTRLTMAPHQAMAPALAAREAEPEVSTVARDVDAEIRLIWHGAPDGAQRSPGPMKTIDFRAAPGSPATDFAPGPRPTASPPAGGSLRGTQYASTAGPAADDAAMPAAVTGFDRAEQPGEMGARLPRSAPAGSVRLERLSERQLDSLADRLERRLVRRVAIDRERKGLN